MQLFVNHFIGHSDASSNFLINSCKSLEKAEMVLSSAKLCKSAALNQRNGSLIKMLKKIGPNMEPSLVLLIFTSHVDQLMSLGNKTLTMTSIFG